jgi:hypothetical protein
VNLSANFYIAHCVLCKIPHPFSRPCAFQDHYFAVVWCVSRLVQPAACMPPAPSQKKKFGSLALLNLFWFCYFVCLWVMIYYYKIVCALNKERANTIIFCFHRDSTIMRNAGEIEIHKGQWYGISLSMRSTSSMSVPWIFWQPFVILFRSFDFE